MEELKTKAEETSNIF